MEPGRALRGLIAVLSCVFQATASQAAPHAASPGPGIPKLTFAQSQLFKYFGTTRIGVPAGGKLTALSEMHNGYMVTPFGDCCEVGSGGWIFYDLSRLPNELTELNRLTAADLREQNVIPFHNRDGRMYAATMGKSGVYFQDWTEAPANPRILTYMVLPEMKDIPYEGPWWIFWQAPYLYAGGVSSGLYIINAADPAHPVLVKRIPNSGLGGFNTATVNVVGNLMYLTENQGGQGVAIMDVSNPVTPRLLAVTKAEDSRSYTSLPNGNLLYVAGRQQGFKIYAIGKTSEIRMLSQMKEITGAAYLTYQDGYIHLGSNGFVTTATSQGGQGYYKIDVRDPAHPRTVQHIDATQFGNVHLDWNSVLGNLIFTSDDMKFGSAVMAHDTLPDKLPPVVTMVVPQPGDVDQKPTSRVGITFSDRVDIRTLNDSTFTLRPLGGPALPAWYSTQHGIASLWPKEPLRPNTTYEVAVNAGGVKDLSGNAVSQAFLSRFSTGSTVQLAMAPESGSPAATGFEAMLHPVSGEIRIRIGSSPRPMRAAPFLSLFDSHGRKVRGERLSPHADGHTWIFRSGRMTPGVYGARVESGSTVLSQALYIP